MDRKDTRNKPDWREKRQHFQDLLKSAKECRRWSEEEGLWRLPITYSGNPEFIACSHCKRTFAPANIRHERMCKELPRPFARRAKSKSLTNYHGSIVTSRGGRQESPVGRVASSSFIKDTSERTSTRTTGLQSTRGEIERGRGSNWLLRKCS